MRDFVHHGASIWYTGLPKLCREFAESGQRRADADPFDIYVVDLDGTQRKRLTDVDGDAVKPAWSSDGNTIIFVCLKCNGVTGSRLYKIAR